MPEIAEVEIMARQLHRWTQGKALVAVEPHDDAFVGLTWDMLIGHPVRSVARRGKYALAHFDGGHTLVLHYRMTGKTVLDPGRDRRARVRFVFGGTDVVAFVDPRRFGTLDILPTSALEGWFTDKRLGPEPWPALRLAAWWCERLGGVRSPIKVAMMRQDRVAGLGNIAATEILFRARIHPTRKATTLTDEEWTRIAAAVPEFINHTIAEEGGDEIQYVNQGGEGSFAIYGKGGEACPVCGGEILRMVQAGRGTTYCPACQSLD